MHLSQMRHICLIFCQMRQVWLVHYQSHCSCARLSLQSCAAPRKLFDQVGYESPQITPDLTAAHSWMPIHFTQMFEQLHENWEVAVRIAAAFPSARRVADLAGGNGLLGWMLLLLDTTDSLSVLCVDKVLTHGFL